jgi:hypothetical protein
MSVGVTLLMVLIMSLVIALPAWPHARGWGYGPSGGVGVALAIVGALLFVGGL